MAKIERFNGDLKAFASEYVGQERTVFGTDTFSDNITDQINSFFKRGWGIVGPSDSPKLQHFNALGYTLSQILAYIHQVGIVEHNPAQYYPEHAVTMYDGEIYISRVEGATETPGTGSEWKSWQFYDNAMSGLASETFQDAIDELSAKSIPNWNEINPWPAGVLVRHIGFAWLSLSLNTNSEPSDANTNWHRINRPATTSQAGIVRLNDSLTSTSTTQGATINAAKKANDNANTRLRANDPSVTNAREWTADTMGAAEAQGGTATVRRAVTSRILRQAADAAIAASTGIVLTADISTSQTDTTPGKVLGINGGGVLGLNTGIDRNTTRYYPNYTLPNTLVATDNDHYILIGRPNRDSPDDRWVVSGTFYGWRTGTLAASYTLRVQVAHSGGGTWGSVVAQVSGSTTVTSTISNADIVRGYYAGADRIMIRISVPSIRNIRSCSFSGWASQHCIDEMRLADHTEVTNVNDSILDIQPPIHIFDGVSIRKTVTGVPLFAGMGLLGLGSGPQNLTASRALNTIYTNTGLGPKVVVVTLDLLNNLTYFRINDQIVGEFTLFSASTIRSSITAIVMPLEEYSVTTAGGAIVQWSERG